MTADPADRMVEPGPASTGDITAPPDVAEADGLEQALPVERDGSDTDVYGDPMPAEANPDDVVEQRLEVPLEDEDYPAM